jgi:Transglycosylase SLT domain
MIAETHAPSPSPRSSDVLAALKAASERTGTEFAYLLATASRESGLNSQARSASSSAAGLFQFIDNTWLGLIKRFGHRCGLGQYASAVEDKGDGHYAVASPATKTAILALRQDAKFSALIAGEAANATKQSLECALGRPICDGELYAAHFLGEGGARQLFEAKANTPDLRADALFPQAAKANRTVFYHGDGTSKSVSELYAWLVKDAPLSAKLAPAVPHSVTVPVASAAIGDTGPQHAFGEVERQTPVIPLVSRRPADIASSGRATQEYRLPQRLLLLDSGALEILAGLAQSVTLRRAT